MNKNNLNPQIDLFLQNRKKIIVSILLCAVPVLGEDLERHQAIAEWVKNNSAQVDLTGMTGSNTPNPGNPGRQPANITLYDCKG